MKKRLLNILLLFCLLTGVSEVWGRHIVGGDITYECKGGGIYEFTMKIYRDPFGGGAGFDDPASIGIYRCGNNTPCSSLSVSNAFLTLSVPVQQVKVIENPSYPCLIVPPNIQVEEGVYKFTVTLPPSNENYFIVYQRCCRNNTINNIFNPEDTGASFTIEITPLAQQLCNNSPVFNNFPPTVICAGEPIDFSHDATDPDGDQLVYEFCAPLNGGGPILQGAGVTGCNGVIPTPPCPPPFQPVQYILPAYSPTAPLGGNPVVSIDPVSGLITGIPEVLGQFVVGVCVYEYRNGQLLSIIRRDFQFNVTSCQATVVADIKKDATIGNKSFLINSCGENTIQFINQSFNPQNIFAFLWTFDIQGTEVSSTLKDPTITFPGPGTYLGRMVVNPGSNCSDSATISVKVFPEINADFSFAYDTCVAGPVQFTDLSVTGSGQMEAWDWQVEPGVFRDEPNPLHQYSLPGIKQITLTVRDTNDCVDQITRPITWYPVPPVLIIQPSTFTGCQPASIFFNNLSTPIDSTYDIRWQFGDGSSGTAISPTHLYTEPGVYTVSVSVTSPIGCTTEAVFPNWITIDPSPIAAFTFSPTTITSLQPNVSFTDLSSGASQWLWAFDRFGSSKLQNPSFTFPDTGLQRVVLTVTHPSGCQDTAVAILDIIPEVRYFLPNAFTPNRDGRNDFFIGTGLLDGMQDFELRIFNRWGEQIFLSLDPQEGWDGTYPGSANLVPPGVYVYMLRYRDSRGNQIEQKGFVTVVL